MTPRNDERDPPEVPTTATSSLSPNDDNDDGFSTSHATFSTARTLASAFTSSKLSIIVASAPPSSPASTKSKSSSSDVIAVLGGGSGCAYRTTSNYRDSSGRSLIRLKLKLKCDSRNNLDRIIRSGCVSVPSSSLPPEGGNGGGGKEETANNGGNDKDEDNDEDALEEDPIPEDNDDPKASLGSGDPSLSLQFEVRSLPPSAAVASGGGYPTGGDGTTSVMVEGISILSTAVEANSVVFEVEIVVRASSSSSATNRGGYYGGGGSRYGGGRSRPLPFPSPQLQQPRGGASGFPRSTSRASSCSSYDGVRGGGGAAMGAGLTSSTHSTVGSSFIEDIEEEDAQDKEEEDGGEEEKRVEEEGDDKEEGA